MDANKDREKHLRFILLVGLMLLAIPVAMVARKIYLEIRYEITDIRETALKFNGQSIKISDEFLGSGSGIPMDRKYVDGRITIEINGKDYSYPSSARIYFSNAGVDRYPTWLSVNTFEDSFTGRNSVVISQRLDSLQLDRSTLESIRYRLLFIAAEGRIREEQFAFKDARSKLYRRWFVRSVRPSQIHDIFRPQSGWLQKWYDYKPFVIFAAGIVGFILTIASLVAMPAKKASSAL